MQQKVVKTAMKVSNQAVLDNETKMSNNNSSGSDSDCKIVATRK